jgi:hypothetical protein
MFRHFFAVDIIFQFFKYCIAIMIRAAMMLVDLMFQNVYFNKNTTWDDVDLVLLCFKLFL